MNVKITPSKLSGSIAAPASKSEAHRILICAALADRPVEIYFNSAFNDDIKATIGCLEALGAGFDFNNKNNKIIIKVTPIDKNNKNKNKITLDCHESGSTLRFMLPVAAALCENVLFTGSGRLPERPVNDLLDVMSEHGVNFSNKKLPFETHGKLQSGEFFITGDVSSQYVTGLLLALPLLNSESRIILTSPLKSADYVNITLSVLKKFGIEIKLSQNIYKLKIKSPHSGCLDLPEIKKIIKVGGDWSGAAFFLAAGALNAPVTVGNLDINSAQGDKKILEYLEKFGAEVNINQDKITVSPKKLKAQKIDIDATPDLLPILAAVASFADGKTEFFNGARLRLKESDRIRATAEMINSSGGYAEEKSDGLIIHRGNFQHVSASSCFDSVRLNIEYDKFASPSGVRTMLVDGFNDHRIVMAAAIMASCGKNKNNEVIITDSQAINKSYPDFFNDFKNLGGKAVEQPVRREDYKI